MGRDGPGPKCCLAKQNLPGFIAPGHYRSEFIIIALSPLFDDSAGRARADGLADSERISRIPGSREITGSKERRNIGDVSPTTIMQSSYVDYTSVPWPVFPFELFAPDAIESFPIGSIGLVKKRNWLTRIWAAELIRCS